MQKAKIKEYFITNSLCCLFIFSTLVNSILLRLFTTGDVFSVKPILMDLVFILLTACVSYPIKPRKRFAYFMTVSCILTLAVTVNAIYYTYYKNFASVSFLMTAKLVVDVGDAVVKNVLYPHHYIFLWQPIGLVVLNHLTKRINCLRSEDPSYQRACFRNTFKAAFISFCCFLPMLQPMDLERFRIGWYREYVVSRFGLFAYQINDIINSVSTTFNDAEDQDKANVEFLSFYQNNTEMQENAPDYKDIFKSRDVYVIHAESMQSFLMGLRFNGREVTPNINRLAREGMFFSNFFSQASIGSSSDTEFTFNTSLMPANNGTVFINYFDREYTTLPKLLKEQGYYTFSMHGNDSEFWNRTVMHQNLGYDRIIDKSDFVIDEVIGLGLSDESFFKQSVPIIKSIKESENAPIYATLITLTNHTPFDEIDKCPSFPVDYHGKPYMEGTKMGDYIKSSHYADMAIGRFIETLDKEGLLENAVVIVYGDHDAKLPVEDFERLYNYDPATDSVRSMDDPDYIEEDYYKYELDRRVPFIIWTKDKAFDVEIDTAMGMIDAMPTLGNMLGVSNKYQLGHDIFSMENNVVVFPNGNYVTDIVYYNSQKDEYRMLCDEPVHEEYIYDKSDYANRIIEMSNYIIDFDLIRKNETEQSIILRKPLYHELAENRKAYCPDA